MEHVSVNRLRHKVAGVRNDKPSIPKNRSRHDSQNLHCNAFHRAGRLGVGRLGKKPARARLDANGNLDALIARHATANNLPEDLVRRVIKRESGGNPRVVYKGNYGLMQIKLATARSMGYRGSAAGLLDADTNMTYAVKYLAGAYHVADGNADRAVHYYAAGYYYAAKSQTPLATKPTPMRSMPSRPWWTSRAAAADRRRRACRVASDCWRRPPVAAWSFCAPNINWKKIGQRQV